MITVRTWDEAEGLGIEVSGHAAPTNADLKAVRTCAGVSALFVGLWDFAGRPGVWREGYVKMTVPPAFLHLIPFIFSTLGRIGEAYPGYLELLREDTLIW